MPFYSSSRGLPQRFRLILSSFMQHDSLPFAQVLPEATIQQAFADADADFAQEEGNIYTPALTLWAFLSQGERQVLIYPLFAWVGLIFMSYLGNVLDRSKRASYGFISFLDSLIPSG